MSDMADVIWSHLEHNGDEYDLAYSRSIRKLADDLQTLLSAAGFGLLADAKAEAWDEGYDRAESDHDGTGFWTKRLRGNPYRATS